MSKQYLSKESIDEIEVKENCKLRYSSFILKSVWHQIKTTPLMTSILYVYWKIHNKITLNLETKYLYSYILKLVTKW